VADAHTFEFRPGRLGQAQGPAGVALTELTNFGLASVLARKGRAADVARLIRSAHGIELPTTPRVVEASDASFLWNGP
jgi:sarcosine oxidase subunit gamma